LYCVMPILIWSQSVAMTDILLSLGVNPQSVRGSRTGVFVGCSASEAHDAWTADAERVTGYEMTGCTRSMFANRLSYFFDFRGVYCMHRFPLLSVVEYLASFSAYRNTKGLPKIMPRNRWELLKQNVYKPDTCGIASAIMLKQCVVSICSL